jgi:hypothetical protein
MPTPVLTAERGRGGRVVEGSTLIRAVVAKNGKKAMNFQTL